MVEFGFEIAHHDQPLVPTSLQFASDEPIVRIGRIVLTLSSGRLIAGLLKREFELSLLLRAPMTPGVNRRQGRLHAQGLEAVEHLLGDHPVGAHSAEADATGRRQVRECADALIASGSVAVADTKLSSAPRAAKETDQQRFATANGAAAHEPLAVGVVGNQGLIPLEVGPGNIALVVIGDQNAPASPIALHIPQDVLSPVLDDDAHRSTPEGVGAGVDRVGQNMMHGRVHRRFPDDPLGGVANRQDWQRNLLLPEPHEHLPD